MADEIKIIGSGITGLSAGYHLKDGYEIFERDSRIGGLCRSENIDGFIFDHSIHLLYSKDPYVTGLIKKVLAENFNSMTREAWIYYLGKYVRYPFQANTFGLPTDVIKECVMGLIEAKYVDKINPTNFEEWINSTFGHGIAKHFMLPYNKKIWAIPTHLLDFNWVKDRIPIPNMEDVIVGAVSDQKKGFGDNAQFWYPAKGGMESLPNGFLPYVKNIRLNSEVTKIFVEKKKMIVNGVREVSYSKIISTIPLPTLVKIIDNVPKEVEDAAKKLEYNWVFAVNIGIDRPKISNKHWVYYPEEKFIFHRISFPMNLSPFNAPKGKSSITAEISGSKYKPVDRDNIEERVLGDLQEAGVLNKNDKILFTKTLLFNPAYIIYDLNHQKNVGVIHSFLMQNGIFPCGRFGEWEYFNMDHSILSGRDIVLKLR